jgi:alkaline phosphatase D
MNQARSDPHYQAFLKSTQFGTVGTYDDHDFGVNDGGGGDGELYEFGVVDRDERQQVFLDFMNVAEDDPRRQRDGVYSAHMYGPPEQRIKVIALDTRFHRTAQLIPSLGYYPVLGAIARSLTTLVGASAFQSGTLLGAEQWEWLEGQLTHSESEGVKVNLVVSSIQVLTGNPYFESWQLYPAEQKRLIETLAKYRPSGVAILSGDIHLTELLSAGELFSVILVVVLMVWRLVFAAHVV